MNVRKYLHKTIFTLFLGFVLLSCGNIVDSPYPSISFEQKTTIPGNGRSSAVAFAINEKGYVTLGRDSTGIQLNDCWEYNPETNNWVKKTSFPGIPRVKAVAAVLNGKAYVGLGHNNELGVYNAASCLKDFWSFDPITDTWDSLASFPSNYTDACVSFVYNNIIYVGFGFSEATFGNELWKYLPEENKWFRLNDFPDKTRSGSVVCANNEHIYFGTGYKAGNCNDWWEYFPETDSWIQRKAMPDTGRENAVSLCINNRFFVSSGRHFGGNLTGGHVKSDIFEYDTTKDVWYKRGDIPNGNRENAIAFTIDGKGYIGFGENDSAVLNDLWSFEP